MADAPQASTEPKNDKDTDKKMRERVDKLIAQAASESSGSLKLGRRSLDYTVSAAFMPVVAEGFSGTLGEPEAAVMATSVIVWAKSVRVASRAATDAS